MRRGDTQSEARKWDKLLQGLGLGMERGHHSGRLIYGFKDQYTLLPSLQSVAKYSRGRKPQRTVKHVCIMCGEPFEGRVDKVTCSPRCRKRKERQK